MTEAQVVSKKYQCSFQEPVTAQAVEEEMGRILQKLGQHINYKGKIIGHLKAMAASGDQYLQISLTRLPNLTVKSHPLWHQNEFHEITFIINVIVFGFPEEELENLLHETVEGSKLLPDS